MLPTPPEVLHAYLRHKIRHPCTGGLFFSPVTGKGPVFMDWVHIVLGLPQASPLPRLSSNFSSSSLPFWLAVYDPILPTLYRVAFTSDHLSTYLQPNLPETLLTPRKSSKYFFQQSLSLPQGDSGAICEDNVIVFTLSYMHKNINIIPPFPSSFPHHCPQWAIVVVYLC